MSQKSRLLLVRWVKWIWLTIPIVDFLLFPFFYYGVTKWCKKREPPLKQGNIIQTSEPNTRYKTKQTRQWEKVSAVWLCAFLWMPVCVFHAGAGLPAQECVSPVLVFRLVVNGQYVKFGSRFFKRLERAEFFTMIPVGKKPHNIYSIKSEHRLLSLVWEEIRCYGVDVMKC